MKEIKLPSGEYLLVEVPEDVVYSEMYDKESLPLAVMIYRRDLQGLFKPGIPEPVFPIPPGQWSIIGKADELTEEQWKGIVKIIDGDRYENYFGDYPIWFHTPKESGKSFILSQNNELNKTIILKKEL